MSNNAHVQSVADYAALPACKRWKTAQPATARANGTSLK